MSYFVCTRCFAQSICFTGNKRLIFKCFDCISPCQLNAPYVNRSEVKAILREEGNNDYDAISWIAYAGTADDKDLLFEMLQKEETLSLEFLRKKYESPSHHVNIEFILPILVARTLNF
jgi:hypothetical protein